MRTEVKILLLVLATCFAIPETEATLFNDGGVHTIDRRYDSIQVADTSHGRATTVNLVDGAKADEGVDAWDTSVLNMLGGDVDQIYYSDFSSGNLSGGETRILSTNHESRVNISGSSIDHLTTMEYSQVYISGGRIGTPGAEINAYGNSLIDICGGEIIGLMPSGYIVQTISLHDNATIVLHGNDFAFGIPSFPAYPLPYGTYTGLGLEPPFIGNDPPQFILSGTLTDGSLFCNAFVLNDYASITLVPEPTTIILLGLGGLVLLKRRKSKTSIQEQ